MVEMPILTQERDDAPISINTPTRRGLNRIRTDCPATRQQGIDIRRSDTPNRPNSPVVGACSEIPSAPDHGQRPIRVRPATRGRGEATAKKAIPLINRCLDVRSRRRRHWNQRHRVCVCHCGQCGNCVTRSRVTSDVRHHKIPNGCIQRVSPCGGIGDCVVRPKKEVDVVG